MVQYTMSNLSNYNWKNRIPSYIPLDKLTKQQTHRLMNSESFCMLPWVHLHAWPDGRAYPCCLANAKHPVGNFKEKTMREIWNDTDMREMRKNMLADLPCKECSDCYEQEKNGFSSMRNNANKNFGQYIDVVDQTLPDGTYPNFRLHYWDVRFSNICNLKCRSCGSIFSSRWYDDDIKLWGKELRPRVQFAGRHEEDVWEQMQEHIPHLDQIYFAGGEPLIMEEHYNVLKELVRLKRFDVRLQYNTNFSRLNLKDENVLDYWKLFNNVSIGASLDAMGPRAEYIRKGTRWNDIIRNREQMLEICPNVDFYVSSTVSIYNVLHIMDFHRDWVDRGLINAQDWNINILQGPDRDRIDVLPNVYKEQVREKILAHIEWLTPLDTLKRAIVGYEAILKFMFDDDKSWLLHEFFSVNDKHDEYRKESFESTFIEYKDLRTYVA